MVGSVWDASYVIAIVICIVFMVRGKKGLHCVHGGVLSGFYGACKMAFMLWV